MDKGPNEKSGQAQTIPGSVPDPDEDDLDDLDGTLSHFDHCSYPL